MSGDNGGNNFFSNITEQRLLDMISAGVAAGMRSMPDRQEPSEPPGPEEPMRPNGENGNGNGSLRVKDVGYFDPDNPEDSNASIANAESTSTTVTCSCSLTGSRIWLNKRAMRS